MTLCILVLLGNATCGMFIRNSLNAQRGPPINGGILAAARLNSLACLVKASSSEMNLCCAKAMHEKTVYGMVGVRMNNISNSTPLIMICTEPLSNVLQC